MTARRIYALALAALALLAAPAAAETHGLAQASEPEKGVLAAGQPSGEQLQVLAEEGYRSVIDLRPAEEPHGFDEAEAARENGLAYVNIPVTLAGLDQTTIDRFLAAFKEVERPVLLHCATSNRVGALYYAWLVLEQGMAEGEAVERARAAGLKSPELEDRIVALVAERRNPSSPRP